MVDFHDVRRGGRSLGLISFQLWNLENAFDTRSDIETARTGQAHASYGLPRAWVASTGTSGHMELF